MIGMSGILLFLFVGFNYAFNGPNGMVDTMWDVANDTLGPVESARFDTNLQVLRSGFGVGCVLCFLIGIAIFVMDALHDPQGGVRY